MYGLNRLICSVYERVICIVLAVSFPICTLLRELKAGRPRDHGFVLDGFISLMCDLFSSSWYGLGI